MHQREKDPGGGLGDEDSERDGNSDTLTPPQNQWRSSADPGASWSRAVRAELTLQDIAYSACHRALHTVGAQAMC